VRGWSKGLRSVASGYAERSSPLLFQFGGEGRRGGISERGVGPPGVVIIDPCGDLLTGVLNPGSIVYHLLTFIFRRSYAMFDGFVVFGDCMKNVVERKLGGAERAIAVIPN
jgi:hypothetical protein